MMPVRADLSLRLVLGGDVAQFVSPAVLRRLQARVAKA